MTGSEITLQRNADALVSREVHLCLSSMVATLAAPFDHDHINEDLDALHEQAQELFGPILDYEEAARQAGWTESRLEVATKIRANGEWDPDADGELPTSWEEVCERYQIEPYEWEVFEHWAVSTWLAEKLAAAGERVDTDFAGLNVWARTTTGQAISMDAVIRTIVAELHA